jgi:hypothetical protein
MKPQTSAASGNRTRDAVRDWRSAMFHRGIPGGALRCVTERIKGTYRR